ncbi:hypothetical protein ABPG75_005648 [Micractinium tetrahymenae]
MGRKTYTYDVDTRNETNYRFEQQQKNLGTQLGGVIFMCNNRTYHTCMENQMFGLPSPHWCYVQYVRAGMPCFLYNFERRELHGIFKAASDGEWEIDPLGWTDGSRRTPYPCQVTFETYLDCPPIGIDQLRAVIAENYIGNTDKFQQELTKKQATELCALFRRKYEAVHGAAAAAAATASASAAFAAPARPAAAEAWPSLGAGSSSGAAGGSNPWMGRGLADANGNGVAAMEAEPAGPPDLGGKTFAQIQAEEEAKARKAAKAAAKQQAAAPAARPGSAGGSAGGAAVAAAAQRIAYVAAQQQAQQPAAAAAPAASAGSTGAGSSSDSRPGVDELGDELTALEGTLKPLISNMMDLRLEAELRTAGALQAHLARLDDKLMKVQKERGRDMMQNQKLAAQLEQLQQENAALKQALRLSQQGGAAAPAAAGEAAAGPSTSAPGAAAPPASKPAGAAAPAGAARGDEVYLLGGNSQVNAGADDGGWLSSVLVYSPRSQTWRQGPDMPLMRGYGCSGVLGHNLYVMGGGNSHEWLGDCQRLDLRTGRWLAGPALSSLRGCAGAAALGSRLYVAGGGMADVQHDTVEIFNPEINAWMPGPKLRAKRFSTAAGSLDGCVYVTGGYDGSYLQTAERLDPREGKWQTIPDMLERRGAHACTAGPGGLLYVVGGYDVTQEDAFMFSVEAFDPRAGKWLPKARMAQGRAYGAAAHAEGSLWVVGGMSGEQYNEMFERYDHQADAWVGVPLPPQVSTVRAFTTASVVPAAAF